MMNADIGSDGRIGAFEWLGAWLLVAILLGMAAIGYNLYRAVDEAFSTFQPPLTPLEITLDSQVQAVYAVAVYECSDLLEPAACVLNQMIANTSGSIQDYFRSQAAQVYVDRTGTALTASS